MTASLLPPDRPPCRPTGPTVVLLHASASSSRQWDALAQALQPTHDVQAIDLHGHGRRPVPSGARPLSLHDDAALALDALERAGGGHLVGHSYGGAVALHLAARHPGLVRSLALYEPVLFHLLGHRSPTSPATTEAFALAARLKRLVQNGQNAEAAERFVDYWSGTGAWQRMSLARPPAEARSPLAGPAAGRRVPQCPPDRRASIAARMPTVVAHFDTLIREPLPEASLRRVAMRTLVLHGTRSTPAALLLARHLYELLPGATHEAMPGLGHMGPLTDAPRVAERLLRFLQTPVMAARATAEAMS